MAKGVQLNWAQFCFGYQNQKKNIQGARRFQSLKCLVIGIYILLTSPIELAPYTITLIFSWMSYPSDYIEHLGNVKLGLQTLGYVLRWDIHTDLKVTQKQLVV